MRLIHSSVDFQILPFQRERHIHLIEPLTEILHRSYAPLAAQGMNYTASYQSPQSTLERLADGESYLLFAGDTLCGTVSLKPTQNKSTCDWYNQPGVFFFGQFGVDPGYQGRGIGSRVMDHLEMRAAELGARELALDTSERAKDLISMYKKRGYRFIQHQQWEGKTYRSVILSKPL